MSPVGFLHIPVPRGDIDFAEEFTNAYIALLDGDIYLGTAAGTINTIRESYPQDDDEPEVIRSKDEAPAILVYTQSAGVPQKGSGYVRLAYQTTIDVVVIDGQRRRGFRNCDRYREEAIHAISSGNVDGATAFLASGYQSFLLDDGIETGDVQTGLKKNRHAQWCRVVVNEFIEWCSPA